MKTFFSIAVLAGAIFIQSSVFTQSQRYQCTLIGEVIHRDSKHLLFAKETEDLRGEPVVIPIIDGKFEHQWYLQTNTIESFSFQFLGKLI
jgi:hypothetical protein